MMLAQRMRRLAHKLEPGTTLAAFPAAPETLRGPSAYPVGVAYVATRDADGVTIVTADRPPVNAMNVELLGELVEALEATADDPPAALVIAGREGCFSAGVDLKAAPAYSPQDQRRMVSGINRMVLAAYGMRCAVVAAVTGHAIAGGLVLALCADHRIASSEGRYGLTEVKVGVGYPQAAIGVVGAELAPHASRALALGSGLTDAADCVRLGVFDEVAEPGDVVERALARARELAALPADTYARTKLDLRRASLAAMRAAADADPLLEAWVAPPA
jgi:enoyl-CoA hydratase